MSSSPNPAGVGVAAGIIGAVVTVVLYWIQVTILFEDAGVEFLTESGVLITVIVCVFLTGFIGVMAAR